MIDNAGERTLLFRLLRQYKALADDAEHNVAPLVNQWSKLPEGKLKEKFGHLTLDQDHVVRSLRYVIDSLESMTKKSQLDAVTVAALALWLASHASQVVGLYYEAKELKPRLNLRPPPKFISDEQIRAVISDPAYPTREAQAEAVGFRDVSGLYKRLKTLPK